MAPLFLYGVLMPHLATGRMAELVAKLAPGRAATVAGTLFAVPGPTGHYPVMIAGGETRIIGRIHAPGPDLTPADLAELDAFEGADYRRSPVVAVLADGTAMPSQAYLWLGTPTPGLIAIEHGDFARYLDESGAPPLPG